MNSTLRDLLILLLILGVGVLMGWYFSRKEPVETVIHDYLPADTLRLEQIKQLTNDNTKLRQKMESDSIAYIHFTQAVAHLRQPIIYPRVPVTASGSQILFTIDSLIARNPLPR